MGHPDVYIYLSTGAQIHAQAWFKSSRQIKQDGKTILSRTGVQRSCLPMMLWLNLWPARLRPLSRCWLALNMQGETYLQRDHLLKCRFLTSPLPTPPQDFSRWSLKVRSWNPSFNKHHPSVLRSLELGTTTLDSSHRSSCPFSFSLGLCPSWNFSSYPTPLVELNSRYDAFGLALFYCCMTRWLYFTIASTLHCLASYWNN